MSLSNWSLQPAAIFSKVVVMPVLVIRDLNQVEPLAEALLAGGIEVFEVTLRTPVALRAVKLLTTAFPNALVGVGTVTNPHQLDCAIEAGAQFAISPGCTQALLKAGCAGSIPFIPGVASVSELMEGLDLGYSHFKLFPAAAVGGIALLRSIYGPFPEARFCPTGGINALNYAEYLALPNVSCVGGSWIVPDEALTQKNWSLITQLCLTVPLRQ